MNLLLSVLFLIRVQTLVVAFKNWSLWTCHPFSWRATSEKDWRDCHSNSKSTLSNVYIQKYFKGARLELPRWLFFFSIQTISSASSEPLFLFTNSRTRPWTVAVSRCNKTTKLTPYLQGNYLQMRQKKRFKTSTPLPKKELKISFKERFV